MPQYLCIYTPPRPTFASDATAEEQAVIADHFRYLSEQLDAGRLVLAGRTQDEPPMGLAIFEAPSELAAHEFVNADPAVRGRVFTARVRPYRVAMIAGAASA